MYARGLIGEKGLAEVIYVVISALRDENMREAVIPDWMECKGFIGGNQYRRPQIKFKKQIKHAIDELEQLIIKACYQV